MECSCDGLFSLGTVWGIGRGQQLLVYVLVGQLGKGEGGGGARGTFVVFADDGDPLAMVGGDGAADILDGNPGQAGKSGSVNSSQSGKEGMACVSRGKIMSLYGVGGGGSLVTDVRCYADSTCNKPYVENDGGTSFNAGGKRRVQRKCSMCRWIWWRWRLWGRMWIHGQWCASCWEK